MGEAARLHHDTAMSTAGCSHTDGGGSSGLASDRACARGLVLPAAHIGGGRAVAGTGGWCWGFGVVVGIWGGVGWQHGRAVGTQGWQAGSLGGKG